MNAYILIFISPIYFMRKCGILTILINGVNDFLMGYLKNFWEVFYAIKFSFIYQLSSECYCLRMPDFVKP